jgi:mitochondrial pyruvate carrier 2
MTPVLMVYSFLFVRWSLVIVPKNYFLAACHATNIVAQGNQLRRALEYKLQNGQQAEVETMAQQAGIAGACLLGGVVAAPTVRSVLANANLGVISAVAAADAGPFTVHFWAPMSKWLISGASFFDLNRPTEKISLAQYTALTLTGFFFSRYSLLVQPINYVLCSVNIALFGSSAWHLGRKINADYIVAPAAAPPAKEE